MPTNRITKFAVLLLALSSAACSTTIRSLTATAWIAPPDGGAAAAPAAEAPAEGAAPAAAPAAPSGGMKSQYYVTYWEGSCGFFGCGRGDTKVKRCRVNADNSMTCVDEADATRAMSPDAK